MSDIQPKGHPMTAIAMKLPPDIPSQATIRTLDELEYQTLDSVNARRNQLLGLWAGQRLGLHGEELVRYVVEVMESDRLEPGPADIVAKVTNDLREIGVMTSPREVLARLRHLEAAARGELLATD
jgi:hypothetical protein